MGVVYPFGDFALSTTVKSTANGEIFNDNHQKLKTLSFAEYALFASLFFVGIFHVYLSCALSIVLLVRLWMRSRKTKSLTVPVNMTMLAVLVLVIGYAVTSLWAIDSGAAIFGFFKFLPLMLYALELSQDNDGREATIRHLPYLVTVMTVLSIGCMYIPSLESFFAVSGRLSGFVQYPNTFAVILLVAELLLLTKDRPRLWDYLCISVLLFGILYTGSRTVFVLAGLTNVIALLITKNKKVHFIAFGCITLAAANANVNGDTVINNKDLGLLQRYINRWDIELQ